MAMQPGPRQPIDRERVLMLHKSGVTNTAIAKRLGITRASVSRIIREHLRARKETD